MKMRFFPLSFLEAKNEKELKNALLFLSFYYQEIVKKGKIPRIKIFVCLQNKEKKVLSVSLKNKEYLLRIIQRIVASYLIAKVKNKNCYLRIYFKGWEYVLN